MDMQGSRQLAITQQQAWAALNDPAVLKTCIPGCDKVEPTGENQYAIGMALKIGPVSAKFSGKIMLADIVPPESYKLSFEGQGGPAGFGKGSAAVKLTPNADGCELSYTVNASVGGKIAQLGQRLIDGAAKSMAEDFFRRFDNEMQRQHPDAYAAKMVVGDVSTQPGELGAKKSIPIWVWAVGGAVKSMAEDFFRRFDNEMQRQHPDAYAAKMVVGDVSTQPGELGAKKSIPIWVWAVGGAVVVIAAFLLMR